MKTTIKTMYEVLEIKPNGSEKFISMVETEEAAKKEVARARKAKRIYRAFTREENVYNNAEEAYRAWAKEVESTMDINWDAWR